MISAALTSTRLRALVVYCPSTGAFTWAVARGCRKMGEPAGCAGKDGRLVIRVDKTLYQAHRLAWLYMTGDWPQHEVDHIDADFTNNKWNNLRDVRPAVNKENIRGPRGDNKLGVLGVCFTRGKYKASLGVGGRHKHLGYFQTREEAHAAYVMAKRKFHEGCTL